MKNKISAFTLIELSAVIAVIGILIAGVIGAAGLVKKSKIAAAQTLTKASPISSITDNALWLESSLEASFKDTESSTDDSVTTWYDQKNSVNKSSVVAVGTGPTYSNTINYIHAVKFSGSTANYLQVADASFLNNSNYTIFVVEKRQSANSNNYFLGDSAQTSTNQSLLLGYSSDGSVIHSQSGATLTNASSASVDSYSNYNDKPRIFAFNFDTLSGSKTYINGTLSGQSATNLTPLKNVSSLSIGKGYSGEIGEIVAFSRSLKSDERKAVEDYLSKKWSVKITRDLASSCTSGIITENGCKASCPVSVAGVSTTSVTDGFSGSLTCDANGYTGGTTTQSYTCANGSLSPTPSSTVCTTSGATSSGTTVCATNYEKVGSVCQAISCSVPSTTGTNTTTVTSTSGTVTCDKTGYSGGPASYTCSNGTFTVTANACSSGPKCTGGDTSTYTVAGQEIHLFTSGTYTLSCTQAVNASILIIGGGGGGGGNFGGGGGAGGFVEVTSYGQNIPIGNYTVTVGSGGAGSLGYNQNASNGNPSSISGLGLATALGGGAGGTSNATKNGAAGGSGGGDNISATSSVGGVGTQGQGNNGGKAPLASGGGGGGGAGELGGDGGANPGSGGSGKTSIITGSMQTYAGGGGGGNFNVNYRSSGGSGGGGRGGNSSSNNAENATGYGSGGGGAYGGSQTSKGGNGSAGVVIVRYTK